MPLRNHTRVDFGDLDQDGWNVDDDVDSWAISYIAYNPRLQRMRVRFRSRAYVEYEYFNVPVSVANRFFSAPYPRRRTHIPRARSVGASFNKIIKVPGQPYNRRILAEIDTPSRRGGSRRPDR